MTSIAEEREALARIGLRLRRRPEWGARFDYTTPRGVTEPADHQFVHITTTNPGSYASNDAHARAIEAIGISRFPNTGISYNRMILPGGEPYEGQPIGRRGAHTVNDDQRTVCVEPGCPSRGRSLEAPSWNLNVNGRAYCMARNCGDQVTDADVDAMARCLAADRLAGFVKRAATLHGHRCCSTKSCPCDPTWELMADIEAQMNRYLIRGNVTEDDDVADITDNPANRALIKKCVLDALDDGMDYRPDSGAMQAAQLLGIAGRRSTRFLVEAGFAQAHQAVVDIAGIDVSSIPTPDLQAVADTVLAELARRLVTAPPI